VSGIFGTCVSSSDDGLSRNVRGPNSAWLLRDSSRNSGRTLRTGLPTSCWCMTCGALPGEADIWISCIKFIFGKVVRDKTT
jgi:hypothetical protein